eukprot:scaffold2045_cov404-Prasinococcus_capsulatus_cf.AAC.39
MRSLPRFAWGLPAAIGDVPTPTVTELSLDPQLIRSFEGLYCSSSRLELVVLRCMGRVRRLSSSSLVCIGHALDGSPLQGSLHQAELPQAGTDDAYYTQIVTRSQPRRQRSQAPAFRVAYRTCGRIEQIPRPLHAPTEGSIAVDDKAPCRGQLGSMRRPASQPAGIARRAAWSGAGLTSPSARHTRARHLKPLFEPALGTRRALYLCTWSGIPRCQCWIQSDGSSCGCMQGGCAPEGFCINVGPDKT